MLKAMLIVYIVNTPGTQMYTFQEFPSESDCNNAIAIMKKQSNAWTQGKKPIENYYSASCLPLDDSLSDKDLQTMIGEMMRQRGSSDSNYSRPPTAVTSDGDSSPTPSGYQFGN